MQDALVGNHLPMHMAGVQLAVHAESALGDHSMLSCGVRNVEGPTVAHQPLGPHLQFG